MNISELPRQFANHELEASTSQPRIRLPMVTFIITNYNYARFIPDAVDSILKQTYENWECLIIDDCSTDGSPEVIRNYLRNIDDPRFRFIRLGTNLGQMSAMKAGLENASGTFVTFVDADDMLMPDYAKRHVETHLNSAFSAGVTGCDTIQVDADGTVLESTFHMVNKHRSTETRGPVKPILPRDIPSIVNGDLTLSAAADEHRYIERHFVGWHVAACTSLMYRRDLLNLIAPHSSWPFRSGADYYFGLFAHLIAGTIVIPDALSYWRLHKANHFCKNPHMGGRHMPFIFKEQKAIEKSIAQHVIDNFNTVRGVIGDDLCRDIVRRYIRRSQLYKATRKAKPFRKFIVRGSSRLFWLKYGVYYRYIKKK